jgi:uncharacterized protein (DUF342 family)
MAVDSSRKKEVAIPGYMALSWDRDRLRAQVAFTPSEEQPVGPKLLDEVMHVIEATGILEVDKEAVIDALENVQPGKPVLIAAGTPPKPGKDGYIDYKVKIDTGMMELSEEEDGRINYRELSLFENVHSGDVLAVLMDPRKGRPGVDVFGLPVTPQDGKPIKMYAGRNVKLTTGGKKAVAQIDGMPFRVQGRIEVLPVYKIKKDVDYSTGNVRFVGDVHVGRSVREDFLVEANDNVFVEHSIEKAAVTAGKDIVVGRGIFGKRNVAVRAGGNLKAGLANNARLYAEEEICVEGEMLWCACESDVITVEGPKSSVKGGMLHAHSGMNLSEVGDARSTVRTELFVKPSVEAVKRVAEIPEEIKDIQSKVNDKIELIKKSRNVTDAWREKARKEMAEWRARDEEIKAELSELEDKIERSKQGEIAIPGDVYPGTKIVIWDAELEIKGALHAVAFKYDKGEISVVDIGG